jgi:heat shock protein HslJ
MRNRETKNSERNVSTFALHIRRGLGRFASTGERLGWASRASFKLRGSARWDEDQPAGIEKIKEGLQDYLKEIQYDETTKTESGSLVLSGSGKGKQSEVDLVFTSAVFLSGKRNCGLVFIVDADIEKYYEKTVLAICESVLLEEDFAEETVENSNQPSGGDTAASMDALYDNPWLVEDIAGQGVVDRAQTTIQFAKDGAVSGDTSVNRYKGKAKINGAKISFGPLASTRSAGPPALMDQEQKFLKALDAVASFRIETTGLLFLLDDSGDIVLRCSQLETPDRR